MAHHKRTKLKRVLAERYAWPGGYPLFGLTRDGECVCPDCGVRVVDDSQALVAVDVNWEDGQMMCADCGQRIESAYGEEDE
jgi:uncharacterized Zn finger protein (UPF0148 family)